MTPAPERLVEFRARTILRIIGIAISVAVALEVVWIARHVITWVLIALFLALALDPLVSVIERRTHMPRGLSIGLAYLVILLLIVGIGWTFVPKLVSEVHGLADATPGYVHDLTHGRGRLGFLERKYQVVEKVRHAIKSGGASKVLGFSGTAVAVTKGVVTAVAATVTIIFLTFFMLLEGRDWLDRLYGLLPDKSRPRWQKVGHDIYRTIGGYVAGNLLISLIAGAGITVVLLIMGVPFAVALGLLVALLDLIPLAGATIAGLVVAGVSFSHSVLAGVVVSVFFVVYQQLENHLLQPVIYGRTVQLSPLAVLISVLVGAELAGILGALAAIPVAGSIQVILRDQLAYHGKTRAANAPEPVPDG